MRTLTTLTTTAMATNQYIMHDSDYGFGYKAYFQSYETSIATIYERADDDEPNKRYFSIDVNANYYNSRTTNKYFKKFLSLYIYESAVVEKIYKTTSKPNGKVNYFLIETDKAFYHVSTVPTR